jgi:flagellar hook protein FlgE
MQALSISAAGMMAAADRLNASAQRVAASDAQADKASDLKATGANDVDYVGERVAQIGAATDFKANAAVLKTSDEMTQRLLDMKV